MRRFLTALILPVALYLTAACSDSDPVLPPPPTQAASISVYPDTVRLKNSGDTVTVTVTVKDERGQPMSIVPQWTDPERTAGIRREGSVFWGQPGLRPDTVVYTVTAGGKATQVVALIRAEPIDSLVWGRAPNGLFGPLLDKDDTWYMWAPDTAVFFVMTEQGKTIKHQIYGNLRVESTDSSVVRPVERIDPIFAGYHNVFATGEGTADLIFRTESGVFRKKVVVQEIVKILSVNGVPRTGPGPYASGRTAWMEVRIKSPGYLKDGHSPYIIGYGPSLPDVPWARLASDSLRGSYVNGRVPAGDSLDLLVQTYYYGANDTTMWVGFCNWKCSAYNRATVDDSVRVTFSGGEQPRVRVHSVNGLDPAMSQVLDLGSPDEVYVDASVIIPSGWPETYMFPLISAQGTKLEGPAHTVNRAPLWSEIATYTPGDSVRSVVRLQVLPSGTWDMQFSWQFLLNSPVDSLGYPIEQFPAVRIRMAYSDTTPPTVSPDPLPLEAPVVEWYNTVTMSDPAGILGMMYRLDRGPMPTGWPMGVTWYGGGALHIQYTEPQGEDPAVSSRTETLSNVIRGRFHDLQPPAKPVLTFQVWDRHLNTRRWEARYHQ